MSDDDYIRQLDELRRRIDDQVRELRAQAETLCLLVSPGLPDSAAFAVKLNRDPLFSLAV